MNSVMFYFWLALFLAKIISSVIIAGNEIDESNDDGSGTIRNIQEIEAKGK